MEGKSLHHHLAGVRFHNRIRLPQRPSKLFFSPGEVFPYSHDAHTEVVRYSFGRVAVDVVGVKAHKFRRCEDVEDAEIFRIVQLAEFATVEVIAI